nr:hypothetical protein [Tanacetum cinerariifolium]
RRTSTPTGSSRHDESSSLYVKPGMSDSDEESQEVVPGANTGGQGEGQARPDPGTQAEGQGKKRKLTTDISDKHSKATKSRHGFVSKKCKPISTQRSVDKSVAEEVPEKEQHVGDEEADMERALEESMKSMYDMPRGPLPVVVIREPKPRKYQPLLETQASLHQNHAPFHQGQHLHHCFKDL